MAATLNTPKVWRRYTSNLSFKQYNCVDIVLQGAVGSVTGSEEWKSSAESDKQAGIDAMKSASQNRDPNQSGFGKVEEMAGKAVGCEGMEEEGAQSKKE